MTVWNPWHGCRKISAGCQNCYMFRRDEAIGKDSTVIFKTKQFSLPVQMKKDGSFRLKEEGPVYTCMTSDFFLEEADAWRKEAYAMIRRRPDLDFVIITKRIDRFLESLPEDWGEGYPNVTLCVTCEDQGRADERLPVFLDLPILHREVIHEPMLGKIDIERYLAGGKIRRVTCGGESGPGARVCDYDWILFSREQCARQKVAFYFKQTGANFRKDGKCYRIPRSLQLSQAQKAAIDLK